MNPTLPARDPLVSLVRWLAAALTVSLASLVALAAQLPAQAEFDRVHQEGVLQGLGLCLVSSPPDAAALPHAMPSRPKPLGTGGLS